MNQLDFSFESTDWTAIFAPIPRGGSLSAVRFLALMEGQPEEQVEEAFLYLEAAGIALDVSDLPKPAAVGQAAVRLLREEQLVKAGTLRQSLEENDPLRLYLEEVDGFSMPANLQAMAQRYAGGYDPVLPALTNAMIPTVVEMACELTGRGVLLLDLIQEGSLGLWQGILSFREGDFRAHAGWWIRQYLARAVTLQARESGVGQKMKQAMEDFRAVDGRLLADLGRNATLPEIAEQLHMTLEEAQAVSGMLESARLLQSATPEEKEEDPQEEQQAVENTAYYQMRQRVSELLSILDQQEATLLTLRFGLEGGVPLSPEEVGRKLGITPEEVIAREAAALSKLRNQ
jgi:RNA polymerase primary sigma factor